jgi:hypothetical protein
MSIMPRAYPEEFRRDVVEIARRNETPIAQIAKDFGISDAVIAALGLPRLISKMASNLLRPRWSLRNCGKRINVFACWRWRMKFSAERRCIWDGASTQNDVRDCPEFG